MTVFFAGRGLGLGKELERGERERLRAAVPLLGLAAAIHGRRLGEVAAEVLRIARAGLATRNRRDARGFDETIFLDPLHAVLRKQAKPKG